jgi:redox-sensitive bicupin YhaK (pirin superfamily)
MPGSRLPWTFANCREREFAAQPGSSLSTPDCCADATFAAVPPTRALLIDGAPLREPIAQHAPFVMNAREQLHQAVQDFQAGSLA